MKTVISFLGLCLVLFSCKKEKTYISFNEKQLVFVNYSQGQTLKFIDTISTLHELEQNYFKREFYEVLSVTGATNTFIERYDVSYFSRNSTNLALDIGIDAENQSSVNISFATYQALAFPDALPPPIDLMSINGTDYGQVYTFKMYKDGNFNNSTDTATLFHNRQFGILQLLFPDGKKIVRVN